MRSIVSYLFGQRTDFDRLVVVVGSLTYKQIDGDNLRVIEGGRTCVWLCPSSGPGILLHFSPISAHFEVRRAGAVHWGNTKHTT